VVPLQQPFGHDAASQTHAPVLLSHSCPAPQALHVAPAAPHDAVDSLASGSHDAPVQQPAHDPPPHVQAPLAQESPLPHALHATPAVPHWLDDCVAYSTQVLPLQQPVGHEVASQTHPPVALSHSWPDRHAPQVAPPAPHEAFDSDAYALHVPLAPPLQHPLGQVMASHEQTPTVVSQRPFAQDPHAAPPLPHCKEDSDAYGTHALPLQQPFAHEVASQTHSPVALLHSCPAPHAAQVAPAVPHDAFDSEA
jgi:hypothetical protein